MSAKPQKFIGEAALGGLAVDIIGGIIREVTHTVVGKNLPTLPADTSADLASQVAGAARAQLEPVIRREMEAVVADVETDPTAWVDSLPAIWRPIMMLSIFLAIANNFILAPYLSAIFKINFVIPLPPEFWQLVMVIVPLFIGARTYEKVRSNNS